MTSVKNIQLSRRFAPRFANARRYARSQVFQVLNVGTRHNFLKVVDANKHVFKLFVNTELVEARKTFEKDKIVDQLGRDKLKSVISVSTTACTEEEEDFIDCIHDKLDITSAMAFEQMDMNDKHVNTEILVRNTHAYVRATAVMEATVEGEREISGEDCEDTKAL